MCLKVEVTAAQGPRDANCVVYSLYWSLNGEQEIREKAPAIMVGFDCGFFICRALHMRAVHVADTANSTGSIDIAVAFVQ